MISRSLLTTAMAVGALSIAAGSMPAQAKTVLQVTTCLQRTHDYIEAYFDTFFDPINAMKTDIGLNYKGGTEVTPRQKQAPMLKRGLIDMIVCPTAYYGGLLAEGRMPGLQNKPHAELRANGAIDMMQEAWGKGLNAHILAWVHHTGQKFFIYTRFKPKFNTTTGVDLTGVKVRSTGLYNAFFKKMGATTIVISPSDVYSALERGVVQGLAWPWGSIKKYGWQRFLKYRLEPGFFGATLMTLVNKKKWNGLSDSQRALLTAQARTYENTSDAIIIKKAHADDAALKEAGIEFLDLKGDIRKAYVKTIYGAKWAENDKVAKSGKFIIDYEKLKAKMYSQPGS